MAPDRGSITVDGEETVGFNDRNRARVMRKFGMLFQGGALFDSLRVWENVAFGPIQSDGMKADEAREVAVAPTMEAGVSSGVGQATAQRVKSEVAPVEMTQETPVGVAFDMAEIGPVIVESDAQKHRKR